MYAILDEKGNVIGEWSGSVHWIGIYERKQEAELNAIALNIPNYQLCKAVEGIRKKPSEFSK